MSVAFILALQISERSGSKYKTRNLLANEVNKTYPYLIISQNNQQNEIKSGLLEMRHRLLTTTLQCPNTDCERLMPMAFVDVYMKLILKAVVTLRLS